MLPLQVNSLFAAIQMALEKLKLRNQGRSVEAAYLNLAYFHELQPNLKSIAVNLRSVSHLRLMEAFEFIDTNKSGSLDKKEIMDAFNGMGIYVQPHVSFESGSSL